MSDHDDHDPLVGAHLDTLAVRSGIHRTHEGEHSEPIFATSSYVFANAAEAAARFNRTGAGAIRDAIRRASIARIELRNRPMRREPDRDEAVRWLGPLASGADMRTALFAHPDAADLHALGVSSRPNRPGHIVEVDGVENDVGCRHGAVRGAGNLYPVGAGRVAPDARVQEREIGARRDADVAGRASLHGYVVSGLPILERPEIDVSERHMIGPHIELTRVRHVAEPDVHDVVERRLGE